jgi:glycosyltransferase involved in cell wall biosynthesis
MSIDLSVIIPTHNRADHLARTLRALLSQTVGGYEVIVAADDCSDATLEVVERERQTTQIPLKIVNCSERSAARARNRGLSAASGRYCFFLDTDIIMPSGFIRDLLNALSTRRSAVLLAPVYGNAASTATWPFLVNDHAAVEIFDRDELIRWAAAQDKLCDLRVVFADPETGSLDHLPAPWVFCWSGALAVERSLLEAVGGFDEGYTVRGSEDIELGFRLSKAGVRFSLLLGSGVFHLPHERDRNLEEARDIQHERLLLASHPTPEVEALCAFDGVNTNPMLRLLSPVVEQLGDLAQLAMSRQATRAALRLPELDVVVGPPPTWLDVGSEHPGVVYPSSLDGGNQLRLFGFALPFEDRALRAVLVTGLWQLLPERLACRIFGESLRVAQETYLLKDSAINIKPVCFPPDRLVAHDGPYWERTHPLRRSFYDFRLESLAQHGALSSYRLMWS